MEKKAVFILMAALLVVCMPGCDNDKQNPDPQTKPDNPPKFVKALADLDISKAPILGERFKLFHSLRYNEQWEKSWQLASKKRQEDSAEQWEQNIASCKALDQRTIDVMITDFTKHYEQEKNKPDPDLDSLAKKNLQLALAISMKNNLAGINGIKGYYIFSMEVRKDIFKSIAEKQFVQEGVEIVGEEISLDGKTGYVITKNKKTGQEKKKEFVSENGIWKANFAE